ncbi:MAG: SCO1664 family protein [Anaerolineales bacterium]|nr:SCO1664 family protein [Anaerolineales bacterium]
MTSPIYTHPDTILRILGTGDIDVVGQFRWSSNYTFLTQVTYDDETLPAVYKPSQGERPLWDFPRGTLAAREVAAYLTSDALGWALVPPTVLRQDGPAGPGSLQFYVDADPERHYFTFTEEEKQRLRPVVAFDLLINNADRKGGHVLLTPDDKIHLIDHGICFHQDYKLRTVLWDFVDEPIPQDLLGDVLRFRERVEAEEPIRDAFSKLLSKAEIQALLHRADQLLSTGCFPAPGPGRPYPYPLV